MRAFALTLGAFLTFALTQRMEPASSQPAMRAYEVRLVGTIRAVDRRRRRITLAYAPLETAPSGVRAILVSDRRALAELEVGEAISGIADTRHSPWILRAVRILR